MQLRKISIVLLVLLLAAMGCISDNAVKKSGSEEKQMNLTTGIMPPGSPVRQVFGNCSSSAPSGFQENYIEFLPGETTRIINYSFSCTGYGPRDISYTMVPVSSWKERDPVSPPGWVNVSFEPALPGIFTSPTYTSEVTIQLMQNSTGTSAANPARNRVAFYYLKPVANGTVRADAEDWLCIEENYNYRTPQKPRMSAEIADTNLAVHPGTGSRTSIVLRTQSQGLDNVRYMILARDNFSATALQNNLLMMNITPPEFPVRSFRNYTSVLSVNAQDELSPGIYNFTIRVQSKTLTELEVRVENSGKNKD